MKLFVLTSLIFILISGTSCSTNEAILNNSPKSQKVILEINSDFIGPWWMNGSVLDFRLYENGNVEYDEYPLQSSPNGILEAEKVKTRKQIRISEAEVSEFVELLSSKNFSNIKNEIKPWRLCTDAFINTQISFDSNNKDSKIFVSYCVSLASAESTAKQFRQFPPELNELFHKILLIKSKESPGKFY